MMEYIGLIVVGLVIGALARFFLPGRQSMGWAMTAILGMAGSVLANHFGIAMNLFKQGDFLSWVASVVAAILLLVVYERVKNKTTGGSKTNT
jgi:uncharacterized membrane protein YeaQ/YmgE (transglycosylase-associated protein family)